MIVVHSDGSTLKGQKTKCSWIFEKDGEVIEQGSEEGGPGWNDLSEYRGVYCGLLRLIQLGLHTESIIWKCDCEFVVKQCNGEWEIKKGDYVGVAKEVQKLLTVFNHIDFVWIPREENKEADALATLRTLRRKKK